MGYCAARGWFKHHMSTKLVNELRLQHAAQHGISYDWTIFTSPQMEPQTCDVSDYLPPPGAAGECWVPGYAKFGGVYTSFAVCTERAANGMAAMYDWLLADGWAAADFAQAASRYPSRPRGRAPQANWARAQSKTGDHIPTVRCAPARVRNRRAERQIPQSTVERRPHKPLTAGDYKEPDQTTGPRRPIIDGAKLVVALAALPV